ncbi:MAG TPA: YqhA family protein [Xanthobacteraceae bacterium]|nr:YqhA family protein [Xanthobacteraceae bacterium]
MRQIDRGFQTILFISRWLIAPFLIGLVGCLLLLIYRFFADFYALVITLPTLSWHDLIVDVLNLVDLSLAANLVLIVIFSGFENFIHKISPDEQSAWPMGLVEIDFGALKQRVIGSIAVIAAVDALAWYLDLEKTTDTAKLGWVIAFPLMFVVSLLLLAISDRLGRHNDKAD